MFEDSLFDSANSPQRKTWPTVASYAIEVCAIGILVLLPMIYTQALPKQLWTSVLEMPSPPPGRMPEQMVHASRATREAPVKDSVLRAPSEIPRTTSMVRDEPASAEAPPSMDGLVPGGIPTGVPNSVLTNLARATMPTIVKPVPPEKVRISSGVAAGMLIGQIKPHYPPLALQARIQGTVVLQAVIGKDGKIEELHLISGHPLLAPAAMDAVRQWRYKPYMLNDQPVAVDTQINVNFTIGGG